MQAVVTARGRDPLHRMEMHRMVVVREGAARIQMVGAPWVHRTVVPMHLAR